MGVIKDFKERSTAGKVASITSLLIPVAGILCLAFPDHAEMTLPYYLGIPMVIAGVASVVAIIRERNSEAGRTSLGRAIVLVVLGLVTIVHGPESTVFICTLWGLNGLFKAGSEFDEVVHLWKSGDKHIIITLLMAVFELVLAVMLIVSPFTSLEHHLTLLGIELIVYPFKLHRKKGKLVFETES